MMITPTHNTSATAITPPAMSRTPDTSQAGSGFKPFNALSARFNASISVSFHSIHQYQPVASEWAQAPQGDW